MAGRSPDTRRIRVVTARRGEDGERESLETKDGERESLETKDRDRESLETKDEDPESGGVKPSRSIRYQSEQLINQIIYKGATASRVVGKPAP